jgi:hypothetical protein
MALTIPKIMMVMAITTGIIEINLFTRYLNTSTQPPLYNIIEFIFKLPKFPEEVGNDNFAAIPLIRSTEYAGICIDGGRNYWQEGQIFSKYPLV